MLPTFFMVFHSFFLIFGIWDQVWHGQNQLMILRMMDNDFQMMHYLPDFIKLGHPSCFHLTVYWLFFHNGAYLHISTPFPYPDILFAASMLWGRSTFFYQQYSAVPAFSELIIIVSHDDLEASNVAFYSIYQAVRSYH